MVTTNNTSETREERLRMRLQGGSSLEQLTCVTRGSSRTSMSPARRHRVNIIFPTGQEHFASLLRLYLEQRGAEVALGEHGRCRRQLVLLPLEGQKEGLTEWLGEVGRAAARGERMVAVVEERGTWRRTDPWLKEVAAEDTVLWVHDYQDACIHSMAQKLKLNEQVTEDEDEDAEEDEPEQQEGRQSRGLELWRNLRTNFKRTRTMSVDSGYSSS